jgi:Family of unknown function (DUF5678)
MRHSPDRVEVGQLSGAEEAQRNSMPNEDLSSLAGQWVALRDGHVVAYARTLASLRRRDDVRVDDVLVAVPRAEETYRI